jgi:hypothetical protein
MIPAHGRAFLRILVAVGLSGLAAEVAFIAFSLLTRVYGNSTLDRMLGEIAFVALAYGTVFGVVVLARKFPAAAFPPVRTHGTPKKKRISHRIIVPMALALFAFGALLQISFLVFGRSTAMFAVASLLHYYLVTGMLVSVGVLAQGSHVGPPNATHGVTNSGSP